VTFKISVFPLIGTATAGVLILMGDCISCSGNPETVQSQMLVYVTYESCAAHIVFEHKTICHIYILKHGILPHWISNFNYQNTFQTQFLFLKTA
jgi:hypothetical protein